MTQVIPPMTQVIPRFVTLFRTLKDGNPIDLGIQYSAPAEAAIPLPGDQVLLPKESAAKAGFSKRVFTVLSRTFVYDEAVYASGCVVLTLSQKEDSGTEK